MKPHSGGQGRLSFPVRADHILERIRTITRELEAIQAVIYGRVGQGSQSENQELLADPASIQVLALFRSALDQARHMLWLCTDAAGNAGGLRDRKLAQAAALLQALTPSGPQVPAPPPARRGLNAQAPVSFFERLDRVIDNYVEDGGNLVEPEAKRGPKP